MRTESVLGGLALCALAIAAFATPAAAAELTKSSCWTSKLDSGARRTMCFAAAGKVKMNNRNVTTDQKGWSSCEWEGLYAQTDAKVTVAFAPGSGKCSNGAKSPQWAATCDKSDDALECQGSSIVDGRLYELNLTFK